MMNNSRPSDLNASEQRKLNSRYADLNGTSPAMNDPQLTPETHELLRKQAYTALDKQGWIDHSGDKDYSNQDSPNLIKGVVSALTLGLL